MRNWIFFISSVLLSFNLLANDLQNALALLQKKEFLQAKQIFSKLADEGNLRAQEELADMYWYGDGMAIDLQMAEHWFVIAAKQGSAKAQVSLQVMKKRKERKDEISYYTRAFDGGKLQLSQNGCTPPFIPPMSTSNAEIKLVTAEIQTWSKCYTAYLRILSESPKGLAIVPEDIRDIMTDDDLVLASAIIDKTMASIVVTAKSFAEKINTDIDQWKKSTEAYVIKANGGQSGMSIEEFEIFQKNIRSQLEMYRNSKEAAPPARSPGKDR